MEHVTIIDTFRVSEKGNNLLPFHIQRTYEALQFLKAKVTLSEVEKNYHRLFSDYHGIDQKCRLEINAYSSIKFEFQLSSLEKLNPELRIAPAKNHNQISGRGLQNYKTNQREYWKKNNNPLVDDIIGVNDHGQITETSRFNIFLKQNNIFYTPSLDSGCLNGCFRQWALTQNWAQEKDFPVTELQQADIYVGNSLRGLQKASLVNN